MLVGGHEEGGYVVAQRAQYVVSERLAHIEDSLVFNEVSWELLASLIDPFEGLRGYLLDECFGIWLYTHRTNHVQDHIVHETLRRAVLVNLIED